MSPRTKKTVLIAIGIIMVLQTAIPAMAQTSKLTELAKSVQSMTDEQAAMALSSLTKEEKSALLLNLIVLLDADAKKLEDAKLALESSEEVNLILNAGWMVTGVSTGVALLKVMQAELDLNHQISSRRLKVAGMAGMATIALLGGSIYKGMSITVDRAEADELAKKLEAQRRLVTAVAANIVAAQ